MNKYYKNTKGEIFAFSPIQEVPSDLVELTKKEIDAHLNPVIPTEELEQIRINDINQKANEVIEDKYHIYKQLNVRAKLIKDEDGSHYTDTDIEIMDMFIDAVRSIAKQAKANETPADEVDWSVLDNG